MKTILVQLSARPWTMQALHLACALARNTEAEVILLRLMQVRHPSYLGTEFGYASPTRQEAADLADYGATAEDYGVSLALREMQCVTALNAVADAAEQTGSEIVFAHVPPSRIPYWRRYQIWSLEHRLSTGRRQLFTLDKPVSGVDQPAAITIKPAPVAAHK